MLVDLGGFSTALLRDSAVPPGRQPAVDRPGTRPSGRSALAAIRAAVPPSRADGRGREPVGGRPAGARVAGTVVRGRWRAAARGIGIGSVVPTQARGRGRELAVLRSAGVTARQQGRTRIRELLAVTVCGWLLGRPSVPRPCSPRSRRWPARRWSAGFGIAPALRIDRGTAAGLIGATSCWWCPGRPARPPGPPPGAGRRPRAS